MKIKVNLWALWPLTFGFVLGVLLNLAWEAWGHGAISPWDMQFTPDEGYCMCSQTKMPTTGTIDPCSSGQPWKVMYVDPPNIVTVTRSRQLLQKMRDKLAGVEPPDPNTPPDPNAVPAP